MYTILEKKKQEVISLAKGFLHMYINTMIGLNLMMRFAGNTKKLS